MRITPDGMRITPDGIKITNKHPAGCVCDYLCDEAAMQCITTLGLTNMYNCVFVLILCPCKALVLAL